LDFRFQRLDGNLAGKDLTEPDMFTGIISYGGVVEFFERLPHGARMHVRPAAGEPYLRGESVAVNGVCLTVLPLNDGILAAELSDETLGLTTLGTLRPGTRINMERPLAVGDRLGGHFVQGHVDATGTLLSRRDEGEFAIYRWSFPTSFAPLVVSKGSIAVDGVSLTVVEPEASTFGAALIPETLRRTNLGDARIGDRVNLEFDMVAKHIRKLVAPYVNEGETDQ
jgi:riboflavin synthase